MKIATWNVNSLRVRLGHVLDWLAASGPDVLALQETKLIDEDFPSAALHEAGYHAVFAGQKTYNGVAILARQPIEGVAVGLPDWDDPQRRLLAASCEGVRIVNIYVPNGAAVDSDKYVYKLDWLARLRAYLEAELQAHQALVVVGDFNIAPQDRDVHDPAAWAGKVLCSEPERAAFRALEALGLRDAYRCLNDEAGQFSWWDYRLNAFKRGMGLRIDHILCSQVLCERLASCIIDVGPRALERPSDHAPVLAEFRSAG